MYQIFFKEYDNIFNINNWISLAKQNYNLWGIGTTDSEHVRLLYPKKDFLALTTSTATISKQVSNTCFLELAVNKLKELIINCNQ